LTLSVLAALLLLLAILALIIATALLLLLAVLALVVATALLLLLAFLPLVVAAALLLLLTVLALTVAAALLLAVLALLLASLALRVVFRSRRCSLSDENESRGGFFLLRQRNIIASVRRSETGEAGKNSARHEQTRELCHLVSCDVEGSDQRSFRACEMNDR
jgi:K+-sensing histidine kinase KdpD